MTTNNDNTSFESSPVGLIEKDEMMLPLTENVTNLQATNSNVSQEFQVALSITEFRKDPMYSINFNWFRFISIGIVPFLLLAYFNTQIYLGKICFGNYLYDYWIYTWSLLKRQKGLSFITSKSSSKNLSNENIHSMFPENWILDHVLS